ncbi:hypothetical protein [Undibacterium oligocarboniphilum]|uniref:Uncharacterized protein n=1 Tax=Undibacterium oligocarboniphilum TaxID=666702 RepID=A0A850QQ13_9BURK|nr:hypothetical protein [Undibacterium oligocarboniphilum]MBC3871787.1 hypothetical protein [Undibacterium oligocarboniphilum]NVO79423.1 hypothetical protein [Undibacterium oligocarboniphilum]
MWNWIKNLFSSNGRKSSHQAEMQLQEAKSCQDEFRPHYRVRCPKCFNTHFVPTPGLYTCPVLGNQSQFEARPSRSDDFLTGFSVGTLISGNVGGGFLGGLLGGYSGGFLGGMLASHSDHGDNRSTLNFSQSDSDTSSGGNFFQDCDTDSSNFDCGSCSFDSGSCSSDDD